MEASVFIIILNEICISGEEKIVIRVSSLFAGKAHDFWQ